MKRRLRTASLAAFLAIFIAATALESDQAEEESEVREIMKRKNFIVPHIYLEVDNFKFKMGHCLIGLGICQ